MDTTTATRTRAGTMSLRRPHKPPHLAGLPSSFQNNHPCDDTAHTSNADMFETIELSPVAALWPGSPSHPPILLELPPPPVFSTAPTTCDSFPTISTTSATPSPSTAFKEGFDFERPGNRAPPPPALSSTPSYPPPEPQPERLSATYRPPRNLHQAKYSLDAATWRRVSGPLSSESVYAPDVPRVPDPHSYWQPLDSPTTPRSAEYSDQSPAAPAADRVDDKSPLRLRRLVTPSLDNLRSWKGAPDFRMTSLRPSKSREALARSAELRRRQHSVSSQRFRESTDGTASGLGSASPSPTRSSILDAFPLPGSATETPDSSEKVLHTSSTRRPRSRWRQVADFVTGASNEDRSSRGARRASRPPSEGRQSRRASISSVASQQYRKLRMPFTAGADGADGQDFEDMLAAAAAAKHEHRLRLASSSSTLSFHCRGLSSPASSCSAPSHLVRVQSSSLPARLHYIAANSSPPRCEGRAGESGDAYG